MVTFDRRYRSDRKGYWRDGVKRDTEAELQREYADRRLPDPAVDDRGIASRTPTRATEPGEAIDSVALESTGDRPQVAPVASVDRPEPTELEPETTPQPEPTLTLSGRIRRWLRALFR